MSISQNGITTVAKVKINNTDDIAYIIAHWNNDIDLKVIHDDQHYDGRLTADEIEYFNSNLSLSKEEYIATTKRALSKNVNSEDFEYRLENNKFFWEKIINAEKNLKIIHGIINLTDVSSRGGMEVLVNTLISINRCTEEKLALKEEEAVNISHDLADLLEKFKDYSEMKNKMEEELYEKFTYILNSKKKKIEALQEFLENLRSGNQTIKTIPVPRKKKTVLLPISDSDSG